MFTKRSLLFTKHSRRVVIFKRALPVFAFLCAAMIVVWPTLRAEKDKFDMPIQKSDIKAPSVDMENVRFFAHDEKNRIVTVTAESVKEVDLDKRLAKMDKPVAIYTLADGDVITSKTPYGLAYQNDEYFLFDEKIVSTSESGYTAYTSGVKATYGGIADSHKPVEVSGPAGFLKAQGFHMEKKGNFIDFTGTSKANIKMKNGIIKITTEDGIRVDRTQKTITGKKNVDIIHEENHLTADTVILYYQEGKQDRIKKIVAQGNVTLDNGKNKIKGDNGEYNPLTENMFMKGNVRLYQGSSFVRADSATLNMKTGESKLENQQKGGRIKGTLSPNDLKK